MWDVLIYRCCFKLGYYYRLQLNCFTRSLFESPPQPPRRHRDSRRPQPPPAEDGGVVGDEVPVLLRPVAPDCVAGVGSGGASGRTLAGTPFEVQRGRQPTISGSLTPPPTGPLPRSHPTTTGGPSGRSPPPAGVGGRWPRRLPASAAAPEGVERDTQGSGRFWCLATK